MLLCHKLQTQKMCTPRLQNKPHRVTRAVCSSNRITISCDEFAQLPAPLDSQKNPCIPSQFVLPSIPPLRTSDRQTDNRFQSATCPPSKGSSGRDGLVSSSDLKPLHTTTVTQLRRCREYKRHRGWTTKVGEFRTD